MIDELEPGLVAQPIAANLEREAQFRLARKLLDEQQPRAAVLAGFLTSVSGAIVWGTIGFIAGASYSIVAILLGAMVGYGVKIFGRGVTNLYGYIAAGFAVFGCVLGNAATLVLLAVTSGRRFDSLPSRFLDSFSLMDIVYWLVAIYGAWWFARRDLTREQGLALHQYESRRPD